LSTIRAAMTQTCNAYDAMPTTTDGIAGLAGRLDDIRQANIEHHARLIAEAAGLGAQVIGLGELFAAPYFALRRDDLWLGLAEDAATGPTVTEMSEIAKANHIVIVAPIYELDSTTGERYNTAVVTDADGTVLGKYRKTHIPVGTNEQGSFDEGFYYGPGQVPQNEPSPKILGENPSFPVFETAVGRVGVAICYDRHFEGVTKSLAAAGAQIVFSPAVTFGEKSERMWAIEFEVDAARHGLFIGGSNRMGTEAPWGQPFFGGSYFVGPGGRCENLAENPELVVSDLDVGSLAGDDPSGWNLPRDRRPDIYS
jgi:beta-ureidopropionase